MRSARALPLLRGLALAAALLPAFGAHAALFEDDDARRAILELRQRVDANTKAADAAQASTTQLQRSLLDLQSQIESLRQDLATLRGQNEQLARDLSNVQEQQKTLTQNVATQQAATQPSQVTVDGKTFSATPAEKSAYKGAIGNFRTLVSQYPDHARAPESVLSIANCQIELGDTKAARKTLNDLLKAYPQSEAAGAAKERLARLK